MSYAELLKSLAKYTSRGVDQVDPDELDTILSALAIAAALEERLIGNNYVYMRGIGEAIKERAAELRKGAK